MGQEPAGDESGGELLRGWREVSGRDTEPRRLGWFSVWWRAGCCWLVGCFLLGPVGARSDEANSGITKYSGYSHVPVGGAISAVAGECGDAWSGLAFRIHSGTWARRVSRGGAALSADEQLRRLLGVWTAGPVIGAGRAESGGAVGRRTSGGRNRAAESARRSRQRDSIRRQLLRSRAPQAGLSGVVQPAGAAQNPLAGLASGSQQAGTAVENPTARLGGAVQSAGAVQNPLAGLATMGQQSGAAIQDPMARLGALGQGAGVAALSGGFADRVKGNVRTGVDTYGAAVVSLADSDPQAFQTW